MGRKEETEESGTWTDKGLGMIAGGFIPLPLHRIIEYTPQYTWTANLSWYSRNRHAGFDHTV